MGMSDYVLKCRDKQLDLAQAPILMGVLNVTPDSFSDGGKYLNPDDAVKHALKMVKQGAQIIDIGGESTRPGSEPVPVDEQISRIKPVLESLRSKSDVIISIDTTQSEVAKTCLQAGANMINDISALRTDDKMAKVIAKHKAAIVLMHMQGDPQTMQEKPKYLNIIKEIKDFLLQAAEKAMEAGIDEKSIVLDPGIGFGKTVNHNLILIRELSQFHEMQHPVLMGVSRKSFIGKVLGLKDPNERLIGTAVATAWCVAGNAQILRVHDVKEMAQVVKMIKAIGAGRIKGGDR